MVERYYGQGGQQIKDEVTEYSTGTGVAVQNAWIGPIGPRPRGALLAAESLELDGSRLTQFAS